MPVVGAIAAWIPGAAITLTGLVMVTGPYPAESRATTSPPLATALMAAPKFRQGALSEHGLASLPLLETKVRTGCALAGMATSRNTRVERMQKSGLICFLISLLRLYFAVNGPLN